jgi:hypothetical protein
MKQKSLLWSKKNLNFIEVEKIGVIRCIDIATGLNILSKSLLVLTKNQSKVLILEKQQFDAIKLHSTYPNV